MWWILLIVVVLWLAFGAAYNLTSYLWTLKHEPEIPNSWAHRFYAKTWFIWPVVMWKEHKRS